MSIIVGTNVSKSFGAFDLFTDLNFSVARGDKIALVGANGCGKTTLLTIVAGVQDANMGGGVSLARGTSRGYLSQTAEESNEHTVWQEMQTAFVQINELAHKLALLEHEMADPGAERAKAEKALERYGELQHDYELKGGYVIDAKIKRVLSGLGFKQGDEHKSLAQLSGGQRVRAALAKLLLQSPDVLLLDEPTNHLDADGIEWLESYLQDWEGTLLVVSHDRYFLDEVCDHVWELGKRSDAQSYLEFYRGGYTDYVAQRTERREFALKQFEAQKEVIAKEQEYIRRNIAGQNTNIAKGKLKRLNRMERLEKPLEARAMHLRLQSGPRSGNIVLETGSLVVGYKRDEGRGMRDEGASFSSLIPHPLFKAPNLQLLRTERAALIGPNGTGKTTFLKTVLGELEPLGGEVRLGASLRLGYFAQAHEGLNLDNTILDELMSAREDMKMSEARAILGRFLFSGDDAFKKVGMLSGGERGRVALAKLTLQGANFLLLDEPTNHLDIPSQEILTDALNGFDGTLLMVSHDRYLVAALATQIWSLERDVHGKTQLKIFRGTYDAWVESKINAINELETNKRIGGATAKKPEAKSAQSPIPIPQSPTPAKLNKNQEQQRLKKLEQAEQRIAQLERRLTELSWEMEVAANDYTKMKTLGEEYTKVESDLAGAWNALEAIA